MSVRLEICKHCPLYSNGVMGPMCSSNMWVHPMTNVVSMKYKSGYIRGCGCRLTAKARLKDAKCVLNKWI
jgi:hypothetical protein